MLSLKTRVIDGVVFVWLFMGIVTGLHAQTITPSEYWKNQISFEDEDFASRGISKTSARWVKFTILLEPYDANLVYFQDSGEYDFHYEFGTAHLDPFMGMTSSQFNSVTLYQDNQQAILGTVILPPLDSDTKEPLFREYGIQFIGQESYPKETICDLFYIVQSSVTAANDVTAYYFPTYEQQDIASSQSDWFADQGVALGSTARWASDNVCYSEGWALGRLTYVAADEIVTAYNRGDLLPTDILLTDGIPAELPYVAGILSLASSTPNSHVAILANTYAVPFLFLALSDDAAQVQALVGKRIVYSAYENDLGGTDLRLFDVDNVADEDLIAQILTLKEVEPLDIQPMQTYGAISVPSAGLTPEDIQYVGGKASNFAILREAIPDNSPVTLAFTFDLWNQFLDQAVAEVPRLTLDPGEHIVVWADGQEDDGPLHANFKLSRSGESVVLYDRDGVTLLDAVDFGPQSTDVSWGRSQDGAETWTSFNPSTPGYSNTSDTPVYDVGLVINEFMADNDNVVLDANHPDEHPDWIELYNGSGETLVLNGLYLSDDPDDPTKWQFPESLPGATLREAIQEQLATYTSYPPSNMQTLSDDLNAIRQWFGNSEMTSFDNELKAEILAALTDPDIGFDPNAMLRFRSSTNVEDSEDFSGAGLYESYSGCLADSLDGNSDGPCNCDSNKDSECTVFSAIRGTFASFYNDNAFLERLRHSIDENDVGMALAVHHSFPDELELANGVATITSTSLEDNLVIELVTQAGAVSVTNPEDSSTPEELTVLVYPSGTIVVKRVSVASSLVPLGDTVMTWRDDYRALAELLLEVNDQFRSVSGKVEYTLDLEYKQVAPGGAVLPEGGLVIKQVRQVPGINEDTLVTPFILNDPLDLEVYPGEFYLFGPTDVFADHRLKSHWRFETHSMALDVNVLSEQLYASLDLEYVDGNEVRTLSGTMDQLPSAGHGFTDGATIDNWQINDLDNPRQYVLYTDGIPTEVSLAENPIYTLADLGGYAYNLSFHCLELTVTYQDVVPSWWQRLWDTDSTSGLQSTTTNTVYLWAPPSASDDDVYVEREITDQGITIRASFYYPPPPQSFPDWTAHTAPLLRWDQTVIEGLTSEPIVLTGSYSQTYRPEHHNLIENFLFEPRLEEGLSSEILAELEAQDIRLIQWIQDNQDDPEETQVLTYGY